MTEPLEALQVDRVLVVLDPSPFGLAALDAAARLAADLHAELQGLFVEDVDLIRLANLPFAREVVYPSASPRDLTPADIQRTLRARAEQVRMAVSRASRRMQIKWTFQVTRGPLTASALAAGEQAKLVVMGRESRSPQHAETAATGPSTSRAVVVVLDDTAAGRRALAAATAIAREMQTQLVVLLAISDPQTAAGVRRDVTDWLAHYKVPGTTLTTSPRSAQDIIATARRFRAALVVLNRESPWLDPVQVEMLVSDLNCPLGLVR